MEVDLVDFYKPDTTGTILQAQYYRLERSGACIRAHPPQCQVLELRTGRHFDNSNLWQASMAGRVQSRKVSFFLHRER